MSPTAIDEPIAATAPAAPDAPALTRAERNRRNAQHSTGPCTPEGKSVSRLNATKHGGTGQIVLLPGDDAAAYQQFVAAQMSALNPGNADEAAFAQCIVDHRWQLARVQTYENNLLFLLPSVPGGGSEEIGAPRSAIDEAASAAQTFFDNLHKFDLMGRYTARLSRLVIQNHKMLTDLQRARRDADREAQLAALRLRPIDIERDMPDLPERIRNRMLRRCDEAATSQKVRQEAQAGHHPNQSLNQTSGFVSQKPSAPTSKCGPVASTQPQNPSQQPSGSRMSSAV
ncbi:MAG: hypothetical protein ABI823_14960 [Bryobacteraceae bacterium]